jgi:hypothetical protein
MNSEEMYISSDNKVLYEVYNVTWVTVFSIIYCFLFQ